MPVARASLGSPSAVPPDTTRRHVGILHLLGKPGVAAVGGGEGVAFHAAQALSTTYRVTLFSDFEGVHEPARWLEDMNDYWGTDLSPNDLAIRPLDLPSAPPNRLPIARGVETLWRKQRFYAALPQRFPRDRRLGVDVGSVAGPCPRPPLRSLPQRPETLGPLHRSGARPPHGDVARQGVSHEDPRELRMDRRALPRGGLGGRPCRVSARDVAGGHRGLGPSKRRLGVPREDHAVEAFRAVVDVAVALRARGLLRNLHIIGPEVDPAYAADLDAYRTEVGGDPWIQVHGALPRSRVQTLLTRSKYGIHAMIDEHFGMAPAEMLAAGCIPFIHASGGQQEIVGGAPNLLFESHEDAVAKIAAVARDATVQAAVLRSLEPVRDRFSLRRFHDEIVQEVDALLAASPSS